MEIHGRSVLVAGGASGLGLATAQRMAKAGARVVVLDLATTGSPGLPAEATFVAGDVTDEGSVQQAVDLANERQDLAVVVNCAGIGNAIKTVSSKGAFPLEAFARIINVNLVGTFNVLRLAATAMSGNELVDGERGVIVNTASVAAFEGQIGQAAYSASKGGIVGLTLPVARDLASYAIRVVTIAPGLFETPLLGSLPEDVRAALGAQPPHPKRLGRPEEYADLVAAVVANPMLNGETIRLDGAIRMSPS